MWWNACVWFQQWSVELLRCGPVSVWTGLQACGSASGQRGPLQAVGWRPSCLQTLQRAVSEVPRCVYVCISTSLKPAVRMCLTPPDVHFLSFSFCLLHFCSFSISAFDSLIIVGTNNISEQSMAELNKKVNWLKVWLVYDEEFPFSPDVLYVIVSGEWDRRGWCRNSSGHLHKTTLAGLCV